MSAVPTPGYVGFARIFWMFVGPITLALLAFAIATNVGGTFAARDVAYFVVLGGMFAVRKLEFYSGHAQTAVGDPATPGVLRRYVIAAAVIGGAAWVAVKVVGRILVAS